MIAYDEKAEKLVKEAERKLTPTRGFINTVLCLMFGKSVKIEEAIECYQKAAYLYKMTPNWQEAGKAFQKAADLCSTLVLPIDAASKYIEAANCYKKCDYMESIKCILKSIDIYTELGRFSIAAKLHENIAELYSSEAPNDIDPIIEHYQKASDYFKGEEINSSANRCSLKIARLEAIHGNYEKSIKLFEEVAASIVNNSLLKYSAKEYLFSAGLCNLCIDTMNAQNSLNRYIKMYPAFEDTQECKLLKMIVKSVEQDDVENFTVAVKTYDTICHLDHWKNTILLNIKKQINGVVDLR